MSPLVAGERCGGRLVVQFHLSRDRNDPSLGRGCEPDLISAFSEGLFPAEALFNCFPKFFFPSAEEEQA